MTDLPPLPLRKRISRRHTRPVSRSFRVPADVDRALAAEAAKKRWTKTNLIKEILIGWLTYRNAYEKVVDIVPEEYKDKPPAAVKPEESNDPGEK